MIGLSTHCGGLSMAEASVGEGGAAEANRGREGVQQRYRGAAERAL